MNNLLTNDLITKELNSKSSIYDIYSDFDWNKYKELNPYLYIIGLRTQKEFEDNFLLEGRYKGRSYKEEQKKKFSFHLLLATIGNQSIFNIISMLKNQLNENDYLTIVYDQKDVANTLEGVKKICSNVTCKVNIIYEEHNLGFWGHGIRNKYTELEGDFIYHIDDDDLVLPDTMESIRKYCNHSDTVYIFKIRLNNNSIIWVNKKVEYSKISTQSGVIPMQINREGFWHLKYGGDFDYYNELSKKHNFVFIDKIIYKKS
jgi:hypothetical protein